MAEQAGSSRGPLERTDARHNPLLTATACLHEAEEDAMAGEASPFLLLEPDQEHRRLVLSAVLRYPGDDAGSGRDRTTARSDRPGGDRVDRRTSAWWEIDTAEPGILAAPCHLWSPVL